MSLLVELSHMRIDSETVLGGNVERACNIETSPLCIPDHEFFKV